MYILFNSYIMSSVTAAVSFLLLYLTWFVAWPTDRLTKFLQKQNKAHSERESLDLYLNYRRRKSRFPLIMIGGQKDIRSDICNHRVASLQKKRSFATKKHGHAILKKKNSMSLTPNYFMIPWKSMSLLILLCQQIASQTYHHISFLLKAKFFYIEGRVILP